MLTSSAKEGRIGRATPFTPATPRTNDNLRSERYGLAPAPGAETLEHWIANHPTNYYALSEHARRLIEQKQFQDAKLPLQKLVEFFPSQTGAESAYRMLAVAHNALGETNAERQVLARLADIDNDALDAYLRLMELGAAAQDWPAVVQNAERFLAVDPLVSPPYRLLAQASERLGATQPAISAYRALLQLDPADPAELHFRLAQALHRLRNPEARRHVLQALEESPRYRDALQLLLKINDESPSPSASVAPSESALPLKP